MRREQEAYEHTYDNRIADIRFCLHEKAKLPVLHLLNLRSFVPIEVTRSSATADGPSDRAGFKGAHGAIACTALAQRRGVKNCQYCVN